MSDYLKCLNEHTSKKDLDINEKEVLIDICKKTIQDAVEMCVHNKNTCPLEAKVIEDVFNIIDNILPTKD